jgi:hypothetical protein
MKCPNTHENLYSNWDKVQQGVLQGFVVGLLLCMLYVNDQLPNMNLVTIPVLFTDDAGIIICEAGANRPTELSNCVCTVMNECFIAIRLTVFEL